MYKLETVLPNFVKTALIISTATFGLAANAENTEETVDTTAEQAADWRNDVKNDIINTQEYGIEVQDTGTEAIGDLKDMTIEPMKEDQAEDVVGE